MHCSATFQGLHSRHNSPLDTPAFFTSHGRTSPLSGEVTSVAGHGAPPTAKEERRKEEEEDVRS